MLRNKIAGIPCQLKVTTFEKFLNHMGQWVYDIEFNVYDGRGYKAAWLERKLTEVERGRLEKDIIAAHLTGVEV